MNSTKLKTVAAGILSTLLVCGGCILSSAALRAVPRTKAATGVSGQVQQKTFDTPQQAAEALLLAVQNDAPAKHPGVFGEALLPHRVTQHDVAAGDGRVIGGLKSTA